MTNKIKLLHVSESLIGGVSSYINEILELQSLSKEIEVAGVFGPDCESDVIANKTFAYYGYEKKGRGLFSALKFLRALYTVTKEIKPDLIHFHSTIAGFLGRLLIMVFFKRKIKVVYCAHCWKFDNDSNGFVKYFYIWLEKFFLNFTDAVINISPHEQELLDRYGFDMSRVQLVVNGISSDVKFESHLLRQSDDLKLLFVGRFDYQKGLDLLLKEFANIGDTNISLTLVGKCVVGSGVSDIPKGVEIVNWLDRNTLQQWLIDYDCVIMPSRWEGMPILALEVLRGGGVMAASNIPPIKYILSSGDDGFIFDINKTGFLMDIINFLRTADMAKIRNNAKKTFLAKFTSGRVNDQLLKIYKDIVVF